MMISNREFDCSQTSRSRMRVPHRFGEAIRQQFLVGMLLTALSRFLLVTSYSTMGPKEKFEKTFRDICLPHPFVSKYQERLMRPRNPDTDQYVIFSFSERNHGHNGGLGDRLGGLITAVAFALRTDRILLIAGDKPFEESFRPYVSKSSSLHERVTYANWEWAGWQPHYHRNMTFNRGCVNPRPRNTPCALDSAVADYSSTRVLKHRGNRAYLCRWGIKESLGLSEELHRTLGMTRDSDLYELAGCMLRLVLWPTEAMWATLDQWLEVSVHAVSSGPIRFQIGLHFRCGDASFGRGVKRDRQCVFESTDTWKGTSFADDFSLDSPVDEATCGEALLRQHSSVEKKGVLAYIASDNADTARQINATLGWDLSIAPTDSCHVDLAATSLCSRMTYVQWFMLALSDQIVMQSLKNNDAVFSPYHEVSSETQALDAHFKQYAKQGPISAFSRYASIYALHKDVMRYGLGCGRINKTALSWQTQGNWLCGPKLFY